MNKSTGYKKLFGGIVIIFPILLLIMLGMIYREKIVINTIEPEEVVAGEIFNEYDGYATMSVIGTSFQEGDVIYINNQPQVTTFGNTEWLTCVVDDKLYQEPGEMKVMVGRTKEDRLIVKSNKIEIEVKEKR